MLLGRLCLCPVIRKCRFLLIVILPNRVWSYLIYGSCHIFILTCRKREKVEKHMPSILRLRTRRGYFSFGSLSIGYTQLSTPARQLGKQNLQLNGPPAQLKLCLVPGVVLAVQKEEIYDKRGKKLVISASLGHHYLLFSWS